MRGDHTKTHVLITESDTPVTRKALGCKEERKK